MWIATKMDITVLNHGNAVNLQTDLAEVVHKAFASV